VKRLTHSTRIRRRAGLAGLITVLAATGCSDITNPGSGGGDKFVNGINFTTLFALPSDAEVNAVRAEWAGRSPTATSVRLEKTTSFLLGDTPARVEIVSHTVDGLRHYGAIVVPNGANPGSLPVMIYHHGGDQGVNLIEIQFLAAAMPDLGDQFVWVIPSYRDETLSLGNDEWTSQGPESPWDRDVDDAMALLSVALGRAPAADPSRIGALGLSRGANVAMLQAIRDSRIDVVVEFFGPTDFFDVWIQLITEDIIVGRFNPLPGVEWLAEEFVRPFAAGAISEAAMRREYIRRSPVHFLVDMPALQIHHGVRDPVVPVSQAESLVARMQGIGRGEPSFQFFFYTNGVHDPFTLPLSVPRSEAFLAQFLDIPMTSASSMESPSLVTPSLMKADGGRFPDPDDPIWSWNRGIR
jgi:hypothetical protein